MGVSSLRSFALRSSDDAHDTFTSTFNFVQTQRVESSDRVKASKVLFEAAKKFGNPKLAAIATAVRLDAFAMRWDGLLDYLPEGRVDALYLPDFQSLQVSEKQHQEVVGNRLSRMQASG